MIHAGVWSPGEHLSANEQHHGLGHAVTATHCAWPQGQFVHPVTPLGKYPQGGLAIMSTWSLSGPQIGGHVEAVHCVTSRDGRI